MSFANFSSEVTFVWDHGGEKVELLIFNSNSEIVKTLNLERVDNRKFHSTTTSLPCGRYEYYFIVDKTLLYDCDIPALKNDDGVFCNLIKIKPDCEKIQNKFPDENNFEQGICDYKFSIRSTTGHQIQKSQSTVDASINNNNMSDRKVSRTKSVSPSRSSTARIQYMEGHQNNGEFVQHLIVPLVMENRSNKHQEELTKALPIFALKSEEIEKEMSKVKTQTGKNDNTLKIPNDDLKARRGRNLSERSALKAKEIGLGNDEQHCDEKKLKKARELSFAGYDNKIDEKRRKKSAMGELIINQNGNSKSLLPKSKSVGNLPKHLVVHNKHKHGFSSPVDICKPPGWTSGNPKDGDLFSDVRKELNYITRSRSQSHLDFFNSPKSDMPIKMKKKKKVRRKEARKNKNSSEKVVVVEENKCSDESKMEHILKPLRESMPVPKEPSHLVDLLNSYKNEELNLKKPKRNTVHITRRLNPNVKAVTLKNLDSYVMIEIPLLPSLIERLQIIILFPQTVVKDLIPFNVKEAGKPDSNVTKNDNKTKLNSPTFDMVIDILNEVLDDVVSTSKEIETLSCNKTENVICNKTEDKVVNCNKTETAIGNKTKKVVINGMDHLGRIILIESMKKNVPIIAINDPFVTLKEAVQMLNTELKQQKNFKISFSENNGRIVVNDKHVIEFFTERDPVKLDWSKLKADYLIETNESQSALQYLNKGEKEMKKNCSEIILANPNVNYPTQSILRDKPEHSKIVTIASPSANALIPVLAILIRDKTIQSCNCFIVKSICNSGSGAIKCLSAIKGNKVADCLTDLVPFNATQVAQEVISEIPSVLGKLFASGVYVPTQDVSMIQLSVIFKEEVLLKDLFGLIRDASQKEEFQDCLRIVGDQDCHNNLASSSFKGDSHSCIIDVSRCIQIGPKTIHMCIWFDNEIPNCQRIVEFTCENKKV